MASSSSSAPDSGSLVAGHYNDRPNVDVHQREESKILRLKNFNNWTKSVLIAHYCKRDYSVLDMGCGKGGDIQKWGLAKIKEYVGADIADVSIKQAQERYRDRPPGYPATFLALDCYSVRFPIPAQFITHPQNIFHPMSPYISLHSSFRQNSLAPLLPPNQTFDLVSMQFCLHYSFETEAKARQMLTNVTSNMVSGGWFIGTIPEANWIVKRLRGVPREGDPALPEAERTEPLKFGNSIYSIRFEQPEPFGKFGCKYWFHLEDAVDCPEYLVHFPTFQSLASEYGLELRLKTGFHEFYKTMACESEFALLLKRMKVYDRGESMSEEEWEAAGECYAVFIGRSFLRTRVSGVKDSARAFGVKDEFA
ncbi:guanine-N(7)-methyltransferase domain-containing protein [Jimgerdemannia flammicorona]|uniref:mRNA cap guanine-N(7) methyltransferase n=1 Tax=Jimgerdemannia flammicorona TaxID=994334 RepID=A0A433DA35_9FUNG|nr:guanine-N(7)-methyltransferase domain-containing protein [Jimgerdemannia flammicorona]